MARTLIIKNADFSVNKIETVIIGGEVPCTGISLDESTLSITHIGDTGTLVATVSPVDTTDAVVWSSSDNDVVVVAGGTVTAIGCGTATITATCGSYSATCAVTVTHIASDSDLSYELNTYLGKSSSNDYLQGGELENYAQMYSSIGINPLYYQAYSKHPYLIPKGAKKIEITGSVSAKIFYMSSTAEGTGGGRAKVFPLDSAGSAYNATPITANIPNRVSGDYEGMDAVAFSIKYSGGTISDEVMEGVTVRFTA